VAVGAGAADPDVDVDEMLGESQGAHEGHYAGPPDSGWEKRDWRGGESTWFMLGPIIAAATGAFLLGVVPHAAVFLQIVQRIVSDLPGVAI
jgi:NADH-quinone oxidoreductase subunit L/multicomponent Na+:H+ antiporter subunit D